MKVSVIYKLKNRINHRLLCILPASPAKRDAFYFGGYEIPQKHVGLLYQLTVPVEDLKNAETTHNFPP